MKARTITNGDTLAEARGRGVKVTIPVRLEQQGQGEAFLSGLRREREEDLLEDSDRRGVVE